MPQMADDSPSNPLGHGYGKVWQAGFRGFPPGRTRANLVERDVQTSNCRGNSAAPNASAAPGAWVHDEITAGKLEIAKIGQDLREIRPIMVPHSFTIVFF